jgi:SAM-dependent methyltransferase
VRNPTDWEPTKFVQGECGWEASRDSREVSTGSLVIADRIASAYDRMISVYAKGNLLDLGCGKAPLFGMYAHLVDLVTCVDWNKSLHHLDHIDCLADVSRPLPFLSGSFDTVVLTDVLEHLPHPWSAMREVARVLRPQGHLLLGVPFLYGIHEAPHDYYRYTEHILRELCENSGLEVLELHPYGGTKEILADLISKAMVRTRFGGPMARLLAACMRSRRPMRPTATPLGYTAVARRT